MIFCLVINIAEAEISRSAKMPSFYVPTGVLRTTSPDKSLPTPMAISKKRNSPISNRNAGYTNSIVNNTNITTYSAHHNQITKPKIRLKPAPIDKILRKNYRCLGIIDTNSAEYDNYKSSIVSSFSLEKSELEQLLQDEYQRINEETKYIINIKHNIQNASPAYRFANYQLSEQISDDIVQRNKRFKELKKTFNKILNELTTFQKVYIIEAKRPDFLFCNSQKKDKWLIYIADKITYVSIFDDKFKHLVTYTHMNSSGLKHSRINAPMQTSATTDITSFYQQLLDDYVADLIKISRGLDINNPKLLRQLDDMQNKTQILKLQ